VKNGKGNSFYSVNDPVKYIGHYYGKIYIAGDGDGTNPWDITVLWTDEASFIVSPPRSP
jgi:non-reducing end alpha-L-arabinofuranosidase